MGALGLFSKIVSLGFATASPSRAIAVDEHEQRREIRRASTDRLFMQVVRCEDEDLLGTTLSCTAADVSQHGVKIISREWIPVGCQLDLWIDDSARPGKFFLSGEVRWTSGCEGEFLLGIELNDGAATDINEWRDRQA